MCQRSNDNFDIKINQKFIQFWSNAKEKKAIFTKNYSL